VVPVANQTRTEIDEDYLQSDRKRSLKTLKSVMVRDSLNRRVFINRFNPRRNVASQVTVQAFNGTSILERIDIKSMKWEEGKWLLKSGYRRTFDHEGERAEPFENEIEESFTFTPEILMESQAKPEDMSYTQLKKFINDVIKNGGDPLKWQVDLNFKFSIPLANFILVLFGAPLASKKQRSGAIFGLILSSVIFLFYFGLMKFVQTLGQVGKLEPLVAAWLPNAIFLLVGTGLLIQSER